jgi:Sel1 repeat-containing protein
MADYSRTTLLRVGQEVLQSPPGDKFLRAVQRAVAGDFEVLGELGRGGKGKIVYLARETASRHLVALQLVPGERGPESGELWLDVLRKLDGSVPSPEGKCPICHQKMVGWGRFCSQCGSDLSGIAPGGADGSSDRLLDAVKQAAGQRYDVLGQMDRTEGGGVVYFAREKDSGKIVALRLQKDAPAADGRERYNLGQTTVLTSVVNSLIGPEPREPAPSPGPQVAMTPPPAPRPAPALRSERSKVPMYGLGVLAVLAILGLGVWSARRPRGVEAAAVVDTSKSTGDSVTPRADSAELHIGTTLPPKAVVTLDGEPFEPARGKVAAGSYRIAIAAPGYAPIEQELVLAPGQTMVWTPQLVRSGKRTPAPSPTPRVTPKPAPSPRPEPPVTKPPPTSSDSTLVINQAPPPRAPIPDGPTPTGSATCATLFSSLEWSRALPACEREAAQGGTAAQRTVGTMHERGLATEIDPAEAARWYAKAAEAGDRVAQYRLGVLLRSGDGVKKNEKAAFKWFGKSAEQGEADAELAVAQAYDKGQGIKRSRTTAAIWYRKAADQGKADAQYRLGEFYEKGEAGLEESEAEALKWYRLAAAQGHEGAVKKVRGR